MIFIDTETTDLLKPSAEIETQPRMTEVCVIKTDKKFKIVDEYSTLVNPQIDIAPIITKITGIDNNKVKDAPIYIEIHDKLVDFFLGERTVIAHNAPFDMGILYVAMQRHGLEFHFPWPPVWHCTAQESKKINGKRLKLRDLHELATGSKHEDGAHRARADVIALINSYKWMIKEGYFK